MPWVSPDNNPKAGYVVYDTDAGTIELRRLDYDIATTQAKIRAAGLPERLAERLAPERPTSDLQPPAAINTVPQVAAPEIGDQ